MEFKSMTLVFMSPLYSHYLSGPAENTARQTPAKAKTTRSLEQSNTEISCSSDAPSIRLGTLSFCGWPYYFSKTKGKLKSFLS